MLVSGMQRVSTDNGSTARNQFFLVIWNLGFNCVKKIQFEITPEYSIFLFRLELKHAVSNYNV